MKPDKLDSLLRRAVMDGPREPSSPECLDVRAILRLLDRPEGARAEEVQHLATCRYCQRAAALARRDREILEAPWSDEEVADDSADSDAAATTPQGDAVVPPRMIRLRRWLTAWPAAAGIAAVVVLAVGLSWWLTSGVSPELLGPVTGEFKRFSGTRSGDRPPREYGVEVELKAPAYLTWLYVDATRKLKLPSDATEQAERRPAGRPPFYVTLTADEKPGPQWIAAVGSDTQFNPLALRGELQEVIDALPGEVPFDDLIDRLEQALGERGQLAFRGHRFEVPPPGVL